MTGISFIRRYLSPILASAALLLGLMSLVVNQSPLNTDKQAVKVSRHIQRHLDRLDSYADQLLFEPSASDRWAELKDFPEHMVIYKYVADTLQSWYNLFSVHNDDIAQKQIYQTISPTNNSLSSPLAAVTAEPTYVNLGDRWYVLKARNEGNVKLVEGLVIRDDRSTVRNLEIPPEYEVGALSDDGGSAVVLGGKDVFKILPNSNASMQSSLLASVNLRIAAIVLLALALLINLYFRRTTLLCYSTVAALVAIAFVTRLWESGLAEVGTIFSPLLYAHDGVLDSFATLMMFNTTIFATALCVFWCREQIASSMAERGGYSTKCAMAAITTVIFLVVLYSLHTLSGLIVNSSISLELYKVLSLTHLTGVVYVSYTLLAVSLMLRIETILCIASTGRSRRFTMLTRKWMLIFSVVVAAAISIVVTAEGFNKEVNRVAGWSDRMAVDRDLEMEIQLRRKERRIARDPVLLNMVQGAASNAMIIHRLDEMYFSNMAQDYNLAVSIIYDSDELFELRTLLSKASQIGPQSNFLYLNSPSYSTRYWGIFTYPAAGGQIRTMVVELSPKLANLTFGNPRGAVFRASDVPLPPFYSYAKYVNHKLVTFSGNYAYPTVAEGLVTADHADDRTFVSQGYRHFVNRISDDETMVISRRERGIRIYFISFLFIALVIYMFCCIFRPRVTDSPYGSMFFSTRMRRLVVMSLVLTMMLMASVSVIFVYQRNSNNQHNTMSSRISAIQVMMAGTCRNIQNPYDMTGENFLREVGAIAYNTDSDITIYTPDGKFFYTTGHDGRGSATNTSRISPDAFCSIMHGHQRYYIRKEKGNPNVSHTLFCPVFNAEGEIICIVAAPYSDRDYEFIRDTVFHTATIFGFFIILLFVTVLFVSSITTSIFRPLVEMSRKMSGADPDALEPITYEGTDEISSLVAAYNTMVVDLKESTNRLAAAERDKAWSGMARQVAHEIKNPLTPIKLEIQRLMRLKQKNDPSWETKFDSVAAVILEHIEILSQTANEFSTFAKLYTEEPSEMDLDRMLKDQIMLFQGSADITYLGTSGAVIMGPRPQTIRVFVNLLSNAVQALQGSENPRIIVSLRKSASLAEGWDIVFEDNGPGVSPENQDKLFTPNFTTKNSGTGLGLAICKSIVDRMGGTITYSRSFTLGGACFTVSLPAQG